MKRILLLVSSLFMIVACNEATPPNTEVDRDGNSSNGSSTISCENVALQGSFAFGACNNVIRIVNLNSSEIFDFSVAANDIAIDTVANIALALSGRNLTLLDISSPFTPIILDTATVNFSFFSGVAAANGIAVVSGGAGGSNVQIFNYQSRTLNLVRSGISTVDSNTGTPDVSVVATAGGIEAFFSQDLGSVRNWGINHFSITASGNASQINSTYRLTSGSVPLSFASSSFPVESEFLNNNLYIANYATRGIEVVSLASGFVQTPISLGYNPTNVATDGRDLFVVSSVSGRAQRVDPTNLNILELNLVVSRPSGVAANNNFIVIADLDNGIVFGEN